MSKALQIKENVSLKALNAMRLDVPARWFCRVSNQNELNQALEFADKNRVTPLILGGGSNTLLLGPIETLVIKNEMMGTTLTSDGVLAAQGGENWHLLVKSSVSAGWYGLENLALIPGTVGAAPMQNIGAYGQELSNLCESVQAVELASGKLVEFDKTACGFGYRDSVFKRQSDWFVAGVRLTLHRDSDRLLLDYPGIRDGLHARKLEINATNVFNQVCDLRRSKLPDPEVVPNAGSFFKNPVVISAVADALRQTFTTMPVYPVNGSNQVHSKLSAGWLIERCGLKGASLGGFSVSTQHALVLINSGNGTIDELLGLKKRIVDQVFEKFGVALEVEPRSYP